MYGTVKRGYNNSVDDRHIKISYRWSVVPEFTDLNLSFQHIPTVIWCQITTTDVTLLAVPYILVM